jgi:hypothetical protein
MEQVAIEVVPDASPLRAGGEPGRRLPGAIVVLLAGVAGLAWGVVARVLGGIGMVPIFGGAGALMLPTVLGGGLAWFRTDWSRWVRGVLIAVACLPSVFLFGSGLSEDGWSVKLVVGALLLLPLYGVIILATRPTLAPQLDGWRLPRLVRIGLAVVTIGFTGLQVVSILSS